MFFGKILTKQAPFKFSSETVDETHGEVFSITNLALTPESKEKTQIYVNKDGNDYLIASLTKEHPQATINLFISLTDGVSLIVKGNGSIHVAGFSEPQPQGGLPFEEEDDDDDQEDLELDDEEDDSEEVAAVKQQAKPKIQEVKQTPKIVSPKGQPLSKPVVPAAEESDQEDDDDLDDLEDDIEDDEDLDDDMDDDSEEEDEPAPQKQKPNQFGGKQQNQGQKPQFQNKKPEGQKPQFHQNKFQNDRPQGGHQNGAPHGKPFQKRGGKPFEQRGGKPFQQRGNSFQQRGRGKPFEQRGGKPFQQRGNSFQQRGRGKPFQQRGGKPFRGKH